jgi:nucleoside 2-deoxyribosyltransferase
MRKAYLAISYTNRKNLRAEVDSIREVLAQHGTELFIFVDTYQFSPDESRVMMQQAFTDIDDCDLLIAEVSEKAIGVGIEIGYAAAKGKPVVYLRNSSAEHSTTVAGTADHIVLYKGAPDLAGTLAKKLSLFLDR